MELPDWIGQVLVIGGSGAAIGAGLFRFFAQNWIKHHFAKDLESAKSEISLKLESAKSEISLHAANRLKFRDKEYEVFPEIWARLSDAREDLQVALMAFGGMPDFNSLEAKKDVKEWVESTDFTKDEKEMMIASRDRKACFSRTLDWQELRRSQESLLEFETYLRKTRIFLSPEIREKFDEIEDLLGYARIAKMSDVLGLGQEGARDFLREAFDIFDNKVVPLMEELEHIIQGKLSPEREATKQ